MGEKVGAWWQQVKNSEFLKNSNFGYSEWSKRCQGLANGYLPHILSMMLWHFPKLEDSHIWASILAAEPDTSFGCFLGSTNCCPGCVGNVDVPVLLCWWMGGRKTAPTPPCWCLPSPGLFHYCCCFFKSSMVQGWCHWSSSLPCSWSEGVSACLWTFVLFVWVPPVPDIW